MHPNLRAKGGACREVVPFATQLMHEFASRGRKYMFLAAAGRALMQYHDILQSEPRRLSVRTREKMMALCVTHISNY